MQSTPVDIIDYDMGNLRSIANAMKEVGADVKLVRRADDLRGGHLILPGVGAFGASMQNLRAQGMDHAILGHVASGRPFLGICLGFQVMFEHGTEMGTHTGLGLFKGTVSRFVTSLHIPHVGWNTIRPASGESFAHPVMAGTPSGAHVYFVHSFRAEATEPQDTLTMTEYGGEFVSGVAKDSMAGFQFHPEKSGHTGLRLLRGFLDWNP
jgi:imidazole glycerol phosphate synthase glutamine amidotransferase subunit